MTSTTLLACALDPPRILSAQGLTPDPWQRDFLFCNARDVLLCCSRGAGKSRVTSVLALHTALFRPCSLVLLVSRTLRQSMELFRYVKQGYRALDMPLDAIQNNAFQLEFTNGSRIVALPGREETIRAFQGVNLLILDEAARVPDQLYSSLSPMTGVSKGRTVCLSTPFGQHGFFWREWHNTEVPWQRFRVPWQQCPRLTQEFIDNERRKFGDLWIRQEYECSFEARQGLVYPDFPRCIVEEVGSPPCPSLTLSPCHPLTVSRVPASDANIQEPKVRRVGGIDFGFRNPFAAIWGYLDRDDVLWITDEIYRRETTLGDLSALLPKGITWYADPAGAGDIAQLRRANHVVKRGENDITRGIQAVTERIRTGRLKVNANRCPNLLRESRLYCYDDNGSEKPVDDENHALAALRYLIATVKK